VGDSVGRFGARVATVALWGLVISGPVLGGLALVRRPVVERVPVAAMSPVRVDVGGFAEVFVAEALTAGDGGSAQVARMLGGGPVSLLGVVPGSWWVSRTTTVELTALSSTRWRVVVGADVLRVADRPATGFVPVGVRWFQVEIVDTGVGLVAAGLPSVVAGPAVGEPVKDRFTGGRSVAVSDPVGDVVARFVAAVTTGSGELDRYAAAGSGLRASLPLFDSVSVDRLVGVGSGDVRSVRAWVSGSAGDARMVVAYDLDLRRVDGRWEVVAVGSPAATGALVASGEAAVLSSVPSVEG
jgi:hypothetical protein